MRASTFLEEHQHTVENALRAAMAAYQEHAANFRLAEKFICEGGTVPMFADGAAGARGAARLAEQFERQIAEAQEALNQLEEVSDYE